MIGPILKTGGAFEKGISARCVEYVGMIFDMPKVVLEHDGDPLVISVQDWVEA